MLVSSDVDDNLLNSVICDVPMNIINKEKVSPSAVALLLVTLHASEQKMHKLVSGRMVLMCLGKQYLIMYPTQPPA